MAFASWSHAALESWRTNAAFWDDGMGREGNKYWTVLELPALRRLITVRPRCRALELATGNGLGARWLAREGASVVATDGSEQMLERAARHSDRAPDEAARISYRPLDVTEPAAFATLLSDPRAAEGFDVVLMNMAIMDVATLQPLADALPKLLKPDGVFVATVLHPVFFTSGATRNIEMRTDPGTGQLDVVRTKILRDYLQVPPTRGVSLPGQPAYQIYFHRPLHELFGIFFKAGLVMDALEEPAFTDADRVESRVESHSNYTQMPAILAFRLRRAS